MTILQDDWEEGRGENWGRGNCGHREEERSRAEVTSGEGKGGDGRTQPCPHWVQGWRTQLWCLSAARSSHNPCAHLTFVTTLALLPVSAALTTMTIVATLSAAISCLIFLPGPERAEGAGEQLPSPATSLLLEAGAAWGGVWSQAGFCPQLEHGRAGDLSQLDDSSEASVSSSTQ